MQQRAHPHTPAALQQTSQSDDTTGDGVRDRVSSPASAHTHENDTLDQQQDPSIFRVAAGKTMETAAAGTTLNSDQTKEGDLVEALERVRLSETTTRFNGESPDPINSTARGLQTEISKKPHYLTVLEKTEKISAHRKQKFKPNQ